MSIRTFSWLDEDITACLCGCHADPSIKHIVACCDLCYKQYVVNGKPNMVLVDKALEETYEWRKERGLVKFVPRQKVGCGCICHDEGSGWVSDFVPCCAEVYQTGYRD